MGARLMVRRPDWPARLADYIETRRRRVFSWGDNDCAMFAADWVVEAAGWDPAAAVRGRYTTAVGARRVLKNRAGGDLEAFVDGQLPVIEQAYAGRGDLMLFAMPDGPALGVCLGTVCACPGETGLVFLPVTSALKAWGV